MFISDLKPFSPKKWPFFYGYWIVVCSTLGVICSAPGQTVGVSVYTDHLIDNLQIGRFWLSTSYMVGTILSSLLIARVGKLLDTVGIRPIAALSTTGLGLILFYMSQVDRISQAVSSFISKIPLLYISFTLVTIGFLFLRFFGQGVLTLASKTMLMEWFIHRRGRMSGFSGIFKSLTFSGAPFVFDRLITYFSWRNSWIIMGLFIGVIFTIFILIFFRDKPENSGLIPDGKVIKSKNKIMTSSEVDWTLVEAKKTFTFWVYNLGLSLFALFNTAIMFHIVSIFASKGLSKDVAISIFFPASVIAVSLHFIIGWLSDYVDLKFFLAILLLGIVVGSLGIFNLDAPYGKYLLIAGNGIGSGMFGTISNVSWPRFFGRKHLGSINAYGMSYLVFFSAIGPFIFGWSFEKAGTYIYALIICLAFAAILFGLSLKTAPPIKKIN